MTTGRIDTSDTTTRCWRTDHNHARLINAARAAAHRKHGENSIEAVPAGDPRWLPILVEEIGEVAHAQTYDSGADNITLAGEILDVMAVASAWLDALAAEEPKIMSELAHKQGTWLA